VKHLSILVNKIEKILRKNPRSVHLLDTMLMILVISYGIIKIKNLLGVYIFNEKVMYKNQLRGKK
jgi:cell shape-determining protein MreD